MNVPPSHQVYRTDARWDRLTGLLEDPQWESQPWHEEIAVALLDLPLELLDGGHAVRAPIGLDYVRLGFPQGGPFVRYSLREALEYAAGSVHGVAVVDQEGNPYYAFSHGDLVSLRHFGILQLPVSTPWDLPLNYQGDRLGVYWEGEPSREFLPEPVRESIRSLYGVFGNHDPKVTAVAPMAEPVTVTDLVFHVPKDMFASEEQRRWFREIGIPSFLPRHLRPRHLIVDWMISTFPL